MKINAKGFSAVEGLLLLVVAAILGFTGWFVWHSVKNADKLNSQSVADSNPPASSVNKLSNYDECIKATGSRILETYPQICVTKDGKQFTQQSAPQKFLAIKEWGVKIPLSTNTADAFYTTYSDQNNLKPVTMMHITTHKLESLALQFHGCKYGIDDEYLAHSQTQTAVNKSGNIARINGYNYYFGSVPEPLCATQIKPSDSTLNQIQDIQKSLYGDIQKLMAQ